MVINETLSFVERFVWWGKKILLPTVRRRLIGGQKKSQDHVEMFNYGQSRMTKLLERVICVFEVQSNISETVAVARKQGIAT